MFYSLLKRFGIHSLVGSYTIQSTFFMFISSINSESLTAIFILHLLYTSLDLLLKEDKSVGHLNFKSSYSKMFRASFIIICILRIATARCIYTPTKCSCKHEVSGNLCLSFEAPQDGIPLCRAYECGAGYVCDCMLCDRIATFILRLK